MDAPRTPDELTAENALICEKLLGWIRHNYPANDSPAWEVPSKAGEFQPTIFVTPSFTTWAEAGLILDALQKLSYDKRSAADVLVMLGDRLIGARLTPADIRAAALDDIKQSMGWHTYLKAVKS